MSRKLLRVPPSFSWPLNKIWGGYLNPYSRQAGTCPDCENGYDRAGGRPEANAALFMAQWYGTAAFDPVAYGAEPLSPTAPAIWNRARHNGIRGPDYDPMLRPFDREAVAREAHRLYVLKRTQWRHQLIQADVDALVAAGRLPDFTHRPQNAAQAQQLRDQAARHESGCWLSEPNGHQPTAAEVNAWSLRGFGHDDLNKCACVKARCAREGVPYTCARCGGSAEV